VTDGVGGKDIQDYRIRLHPEIGNAASVIISTPILKGFTDRTYTYEVGAVDADADPLTYILVDAPTGMLINASSGRITWGTPTAGIHQVQVKVLDTGGGQDIQTYSLEILNQVQNDTNFGTRMTQTSAPE
jgi:hypothetical protein